MFSTSSPANRPDMRWASIRNERDGQAVWRLVLPLAFLVGLVGVAAAEPALAKCRKGGCWGAVAFSRLTGYWVYSMNHPDRISARSRAWLMCEKRCTNVVTVKNGCLALFVTPKGRYAIADGPTADKATAASRRNCRAKHAKCLFRIARCTADFEELKRRAIEKDRKQDERRPLVAPKKPPPAQVEELKL
ncbi:MAG: DUF4189 domain-containing protein [Rhodospirillaceae bacterium]|nr:DUF4189 domain-containing protein [Rhodospirillaceae bacterium]MYH37573.1 DUF4189 domain-containing protein [Rhodospirillaceae bacterium]MYK12626.1 DUF4189 domain-containing protein [Rhodospirillaceae bacterium]